MPEAPWQKVGLGCWGDVQVLEHAFHARHRVSGNCCLHIIEINLAAPIFPISGHAISAMSSPILWCLPAAPSLEYSLKLLRKPLSFR